MRDRRSLAITLGITVPLASLGSKLGSFTPMTQKPLARSSLLASDERYETHYSRMVSLSRRRMWCLWICDRGVSNLRVGNSDRNRRQLGHSHGVPDYVQNGRRENGDSYI